MTRPFKGYETVINFCAPAFLSFIFFLCLALFFSGGVAALTWKGRPGGAFAYEAPVGNDAAAQEDGKSAVDGKFLGLTVYGYSDHMKTRVPATERKVVRHHKVPIRWCDVHTAPGVFDWSVTDQAIKDILADGTQSLLLLLEAPLPPWAEDPAYGKLARGGPPARLSYWSDFCSAISARYGAVVDFYEIWNEPGWDRDGEANRAWGVCFFGGQVETEYLPMLRVAYTAIKNNDPSAKVICGDLPCSIDPNPDVGTELISQLFDDQSRPGQKFSLKLSSSEPVLAELPVYSKHGSVWRYTGVGGGEAEPAREWHLDAASDQPVFYTWLCVKNPQEDSAWIDLTFYMDRGEVVEKKVTVAPGSRFTLNLSHLLGFQSYCDMLSLHTYKAFWNWGKFYARCLEALRATGARQEMVVTEVGCPHGSEMRPDPYSPELQVKAVGDEGVGGLFAHGCRKIWLYKDMDEPPGLAWDAMYYGLFSNDGRPYPAWEEFKRWQAKLPNYPQLPSSWLP